MNGARKWVGAETSGDLERGSSCLRKKVCMYVCVQCTRACVGRQVQSSLDLPKLCNKKDLPKLSINLYPNKQVLQFFRTKRFCSQICKAGHTQLECHPTPAKISQNSIHGRPCWKITTQKVTTFYQLQLLFGYSGIRFQSCQNTIASRRCCLAWQEESIDFLQAGRNL